MRRAIGFDLDGTLFDDRQYVRQGFDAAASYLARETGRDLRDAFADAYFERGITDRTFDVVCREQGLDPAYVPALIEAYHGSTAPLDPAPGAESVLQSLGRICRIGVLTGGRRGRSKLERLGLDTFVDAVVVTPDRDLSKRQREAFSVFYDELGVEPHESIFVGDRPELDLRWPAELGALTVWIRGTDRSRPVNSPTHEPTAVVDELRRLPEVLESIGAIPRARE
ncbi:HAD family hydrolase [Halovivax cerinus]|uniref:HAD family hydrolase n=1 Tax=Halovivax cerinus TaxID=1487865 RepID=A0ABD5NMT5_9EURY|nr:HAD family hydrolase [Halovivax cerinus]